jgi:hypothetical protein
MYELTELTSFETTKLRIIAKKVGIPQNAQKLSQEELIEAIMEAQGTPLPKTTDKPLIEVPTEAPETESPADRKRKRVVVVSEPEKKEMVTPPIVPPPIPPNPVPQNPIPQPEVVKPQTPQPLPPKPEGKDNPKKHDEHSHKRNETPRNDRNNPEKDKPFIRENRNNQTPEVNKTFNRDDRDKRHREDFVPHKERIMPPAEPELATAFSAPQNTITDPRPMIFTFLYLKSNSLD